MHTKCQNCGQVFEVDESKLDAMKVVTCPNCNSSFQYQPADTSKIPSAGGKDDFGDFFEVEDKGMEAPGFDAAAPAPKPKDKPDGSENFISTSADFMDEVIAKNRPVEAAQET